MSEPDKKVLGLIPEGDYEVLIETVTPKTSQATGRGYIVCRCIIQDEGEHKNRNIFYCLTRAWTDSDRAIVESALKDQGASWVPRYASGKIVQHRNPHNDTMYNSIKRLAII